VALSEQREVMDIRQAAEYLGISTDTLYRYASEGFVPAFKLGNRWRFQRSRLHDWMDERSTYQAAESVPAKSLEALPASKPVASVRPRAPKGSRSGDR
jgi:excisionase family DNA binding protein